MSELNAEQIKKALECCKTTTPEDCIECPYRNKGNSLYTGCVNTLVKDTLSLIKELTEENEYLKSTDIGELQQEYDSLAKSFEDAIELIDKLRTKKAKLSEENERLRVENKLLESQYETMYDSVEATLRAEIADCGTSCKWCENKVKADTVRKMQERITVHATNGYPRKVRLDVIDQIAKEMVEGEK